MSNRDLIDAVALKTGEGFHGIRRRGFLLTGPAPGRPLRVMLVDITRADSASVLP
jgi:hypothetical protein